MEAAWTVSDWLRDWFGWPGHFWLGALGGLLGYYLTQTMCCVGRSLLAALVGEQVADRFLIQLQVDGICTGTVHGRDGHCDPFLPQRCVTACFLGWTMRVLHSPHGPTVHSTSA